MAVSIEWIKIDPSLKISDTHGIVFKKNILKFARTACDSIFSAYCPHGLTLFTT